MIRAYLFSNLQNWALDHRSWRGTTRLASWAALKQLNKVQKIGKYITVKGPLCIVSSGRIEIEDEAVLTSSWHRPIRLYVSKPDAHLLIEHHAHINFGVNISVAQEVIIGAFAQIAPDCFISDSDWHRLDGKEGEGPIAPTHIGRGVWLCTQTIVLKGVTIGENTVVAANSAVTQNLPANVLAGGSPARVIRPIERHRYVPDKEFHTPLDNKPHQLY
jgi:acetyltransferase-like isoleucine patch superfamily enzyme